MFVLSESEYNAMKDRLRSQFASLETDGRGKYPKYSPFAFTEGDTALVFVRIRDDKKADAGGVCLEQIERFASPLQAAPVVPPPEELPVSKLLIRDVKTR